MTRKDYKLLAEEIRVQHEFEQSNGNTAGVNALWSLADALCNALKRENARFDSTKFLKACGWEKH